MRALRVGLALMVLVAGCGKRRVFVSEDRECFKQCYFHAFHSAAENIVWDLARKCVESVCPGHWEVEP